MDLRSWFVKKKPARVVHKRGLTKTQRKKLVSVRDHLRGMLADDFSSQRELADFIGVDGGIVSRLVAPESAKCAYLPNDGYPSKPNLDKVDQAIERWGNGNGNGSEGSGQLFLPEEPLTEEDSVGPPPKPYQIIFDGFNYATTIDFHSAASYPIKVWTFSLPDVKKLYGSIPDKYWAETYIIICDERKDIGDRLAELLPKSGPINLRYDKLTHRKIVLYADHSILIGSANFGQTMNKETMVRIDDAHEYRCLDHQFWLNWESLEHPYIPF